jgi:hypothetical protein
VSFEIQAQLRQSGWKLALSQFAFRKSRALDAVAGAPAAGNGCR